MKKRLFIGSIFILVVCLISAQQAPVFDIQRHIHKEISILNKRGIFEESLRLNWYRNSFLTDVWEYTHKNNRLLLLDWHLQVTPEEYISEMNRLRLFRHIHGSSVKTLLHDYNVY